jgi:hypothetical protein
VFGDAGVKNDPCGRSSGSPARCFVARLSWATKVFDREERFKRAKRIHELYVELGEGKAIAPHDADGRWLGRSLRSFPRDRIRGGPRVSRTSPQRPPPSNVIPRLRPGTADRIWLRDSLMHLLRAPFCPADWYGPVNPKSEPKSTVCDSDHL